MDDRIAWAYYELREELYNGQEMEEWINLSGRLGEGEEGTINIILQLLVRGVMRAYEGIVVGWRRWESGGRWKCTWGECT